MPNIDNILKQLKSRKVFRNIAIYVGFAFVLIQIDSIIMPALSLSESSLSLIIILIIIYV